MAIKLRQRRPTGDRGAQAVEFALVWIFALIPLILGLIQMGALFYSQITITQAAREAARQVALNITTNAGTCDTTCTATATAKSAASPLSLNDANITITACPAGATQSTAATVKLQAPALLNALPLVNVTVTGSASMPCGG